MLPLEDIKVIDLSSLIPGALCSMLLADFGAEVIKIEDPGQGDYARYIETYPKYNGIGVLFASVNRNKKSLTLNLKSQKGREIFYGLCKDADVLIESYRPKVKEKLGIDYQKIKALNPSIVYCSLSAYGQTGPYSDYPGYDLNFYSYSGAMSLTGNVEGKPSLPGFLVGDSCGAMMGVIGILIAIIKRLKEGSGEFIDVSALDSTISLLGFLFSIGFSTGKFPVHDELLYNGAFACYNCYETNDGRFIVVAAVHHKFWKNLCMTLHRPDLIEGHLDLSKQSDLKDKLKRIFLKKDLREWLEIFKDVHAGVSPVLTLEEIVCDHHVTSRKLIREVRSKDGKRVFKQIDNPINFSSTTQDTVRLAPPLMGEHTDEILLGLGYSRSQINKFRMYGVL